MPEIDLMRHYPRSQRPIDERAKLITDEHRRIARQFDERFFDGDRLYGYGGYGYHPRFWTDTVRLMREHYDLPDRARILDVGSGKGFMLRDLRKLMPRAELVGLDISRYAAERTVDEIRPSVQIGTADHLPYTDEAFDLVVSINTIHNLPLEACKQSLREIERVSRAHKFIVVDAWHDDHERTRLEKWNLTALTKMHVDDWRRVFDEVGYTGDYHWFIAR